MSGGSDAFATRIAMAMPVSRKVEQLRAGRPQQIELRISRRTQSLDVASVACYGAACGYGEVGP
jgi:hypothetical protein